MKRNFPLHITIGKPPALLDVLEVLAACLWGVESVLALFEPVFSTRQPPLPVTVIPSLY